VWLAHLSAELDNLRAALRWFLQRGAADESLRLAEARSWFESMHNDWIEARSWLEQALALPGAQPRARARALAAAGFYATLQDPHTARRMLEEALLLGRELGEQAAMAWALEGLGMLATWQGDYVRARTLYEESLALLRAVGTGIEVSEVLLHLAWEANLEGDQSRASALVDEAWAIAGGTGPSMTTAWVSQRRGEVAFAVGDYAEASRVWEECLTSAHELGLSMLTSWVEKSLGQLALQRGDYETARALYRSSLKQQRTWAFLAMCALAGLSAVAAAGGHAERALRLAGAGTALSEAQALRLPEAEQAVLDGSVEAARAGLSEQAATAAWEDGQAMTIEQAVAYALQES
jgi:tetratricopeptide (TPR) repeat protein